MKSVFDTRGEAEWQKIFLLHSGEFKLCLIAYILKFPLYKMALWILY